MSYTSRLHIGTIEPPMPSDAEFGFLIDFSKGQGDPQRVFKAADAFIASLIRLDKALCSSIDNNIQPLLVVEDIESGSIKIWLRNVLSALDDQALKDLDWKPAIGKYLVRAKYAFIEWTNNVDEDAKIVDLAKKLGKIAQETDIKHIPDYQPPPIAELVEAAKGIDATKGFLVDGDKASYLTVEEEPIQFDISARWPIEKLDEMTIKETVRFERMPMTLIVKKPDYLGNSKWEFRHGKKPITAKIEDDEWLKAFQARSVDVRPGDALKCILTVAHNYGHDNELISEDFVVSHIEGVIENISPKRQPDMFS